ncbi:MAG: hypothetical protein JF614_19510 [Acidobacteria bacterium]|nr:hypothetical protein [Acidobacteriota bacterium]
MKNSTVRWRGILSTLAIPAALALLLGAGLVLPPAARAVDQPECAKGKPPNPASNCPDQFAWQTLVKVAQPTASKEALFETWPTDCETFPTDPDPTKCTGPHPDPKHCPVMSEATKGVGPEAVTPRIKQLQPRALQSLAAIRRGASAQLLAIPQVAKCDPNQVVEIVHRNPSAFNFIKEQGLWYTDGLATAFNKSEDVQFPIDAIAVKSNWRPLCKGDDSSHYQLYHAPDGTLYGLIALHVSTKDLPNWFWATFEQEDNLGRCDFLGCHDSFGVTPGQVPPRPILNQTYPPGTLNPALVAMLKPIGAQWTHYRLKGSQVDFVNSSGQPTFLGNSVTEQGFVPGASCITCHDRGTVAQSGSNPYPTVAGLDPEFQSYHGSPRPDWYFFGEQARRYALPLDFLWGMAFRSYPGCAQATPKTCAQACNLQ